MWTDLDDGELRARLTARLADEKFVGWLVAQRDNEHVQPHIDDVLDHD